MVLILPATANSITRIDAVPFEVRTNNLTNISHVSYSIIVLVPIVVFQIKEKLGCDDGLITFHRLILLLDHESRILYVIHIDKLMKVL